MSGSALLIDAVVTEARDAEGRPVLDVAVTDALYATKRRKAAKRWGVGTVLKIRVEPEEEAYTHADLKHYYGHLVSPLSEWNGDTVVEWDDRLKAMFLPEGKKSKTDCNRDELKAFIQACEVYAHTNHPEAFALMDNVRSRA